MQRSSFVVVIVLALSSIEAAAGQTKPEPAVGPQSASPPTLTIPRIGDDLLALVRDKANQLGSFIFGGIVDSQRLHVISGRAFIAFKLAQARESGGRYNPPESVRTDSVTVSCGNSELGDIFNCSSVSVKNAAGTRVKPVRYSAGSNAYSNALRAKWNVREVNAVYLATSLKDGFSVDYAAPDGSEWTYEVTPEVARDALLLDLTPTK
jgi:hypothetical protein